MSSVPTDPDPPPPEPPPPWQQFARAPLVPVALALYLLGENGRSALRRIGLTAARPWRDLGWGVALAASIGIPGLAFYAVGRAIGITVQVDEGTEVFDAKNSSLHPLFNKA